MRRQIGRKLQEDLCARQDFCTLVPLDELIRSSSDTGKKTYEAMQVDVVEQKE